MSFSIIVPSFNQASYLPQNLDSILSQKELSECLVYDANSRDGSKVILKLYSRKYPKLWYQSEEDAGQANAINLGLKKATGEFVAYINSDDYYLPGSFLIVKKYFDSHPDCCWLVAGCDITQSNLRWTFFIKKFLPLLIFNSINQPAVFLRRSFAKKIGYFDESLKYAFDYDYFLRANLLSRPHRISTTTSVFRIHKASKGNSNYIAQFEEDLMVVKRFTNNKFVIALHDLIKKITVIIYKYLKQ